MLTAHVYGKDEFDEVHVRKFRSTGRLTDWAAELMANDERATIMEVEQDGKVVSRIDFDEQRDKAMLNGYILPVHKKRLAKGNEDDRRFLAELEAGRRHF